MLPFTYFMLVTYLEAHGQQLLAICAALPLRLGEVCGEQLQSQRLVRVRVGVRVRVRVRVRIRVGVRVRVLPWSTALR